MVGKCVVEDLTDSVLACIAKVSVMLERHVSVKRERTQIDDIARARMSRQEVLEERELEAGCAGDHRRQQRQSEEYFAVHPDF